VPIEAAGLATSRASNSPGGAFKLRRRMRLYASPHLNVLGYLANIVRERKNGNLAYWVRNQHIYYTNVCNKGCLFCSF
jgi:aminodeoxyfutalosine synthase